MLSWVQWSFAQNVSVFTLENDAIKHVKFEARQISKIYVETVSGSNFQFQSSAESTYKNDLYFDYQVSNDSLIITDIYPKYLEFGNNKMTSTQVFSVEVWLKMPEQLSLFIDSNYGSMEVKGIFENLLINTKSGVCELKIEKTNANISTYSGDISIITKDVIVNAETQNGTLDIDTFLIEKYQLKLKSIDGDIKVKNTRSD
jgi:hypothetical protein